MVLHSQSELLIHLSFNGLCDSFVIYELLLFVTNKSVSLQKCISTSENTGIKRQSASKRNISKKSKKPTKGNQSTDIVKKTYKVSQSLTMEYSITFPAQSKNTGLTHSHVSVQENNCSTNSKNRAKRCFIYNSEQASSN